MPATIDTTPTQATALNKPSLDISANSRHSWRTKFRSKQGELTAAEQRAGEYFEQHPESAYLSITEVVDISGIGYGTIIRFCQKLGCRGFQDFKIMLAMDQASQPEESEHSPSNGIAHQLQNELYETMRLLDHEELNRCAELILTRRSIVVAGVASSAPLVLSLAWKLKRIGFDATAVTEGYVMAVDAFRLTDDDMFIAFSSSGATKDVVHAAEVAASGGAKVIAITNFSSSPLSLLAHMALFTSASRDPVKAETPSIIAGEAVAELLIDRLLTLDPARREFLVASFKAISDRKM